MASSTSLTHTDDHEIEQFLAEPDAFFQSSYTAMQTVPRERLIELQRGALSRRFAQHREQIPMVAKLADRQGITSVDDVDEVVPLLFEHTMYKSYPQALLERQQFDKLTGWVDKLVTVDLSGVDASSCDSIDSWLQTLFDQAGVDIVFSSGTSGTVSFFPWSVRDVKAKWRYCRIAYLQTFGEPPTEAQLSESYHVIAPATRAQGNCLAEAFTLGQGEYQHMPIRAYSADMGWLSSRLRLAAVRGDVSRIDVPASLLARKGELAEAQAREQNHEVFWSETLEKLRGERIFWMGFPHEMHAFAAPYAERGERVGFASNSALLLVGGPKGNVLPPDWRNVVERVMDLPTHATYGMSELSQMSLECAEGRYHLPPWIVPFVLDPETSKMLPRSGVQRGRAAMFDLAPEDHWGGVLSGDEVEVDFDSLCACGATTYHLSLDVARLSDVRGGNDKITCAASPAAHAEAMEFLVGF